MAQPMAQRTLAAARPRAAPARPLTGRLGARLYGARIQVGYALLAWGVLLAGIAAARGLLPGVPHLGLVTTHAGRIVLLDPDSAATRAGIKVGNTIAAIGAGPHALVPASSLRGHGFSALGQTVQGPATIEIGAAGAHEIQLIAPTPSTTEVAGGWIALVAALALWASGLAAGLPRRRTASARLYALAAFTLALALAALVARDSASFWPWLVLTPALLIGLAALLGAQAALAGLAPKVGERRGRAAPGLAALVIMGAALCAILDAYVALPGAVMAAVIALIGLLAVAAVVAPLIFHMRVRAEPMRRRLRAALLASLLGLLPLLLWPGLIAAAALLGHPVTLASRLPISPLWSAAGLVPMALLYGMLATASTRAHTIARLDRYARIGLSLVIAAALCASALVILWPRFSQGGQLALVAGALVLFPIVQHVAEDSIRRGIDRPRPDYDGALRLLEEISATATTPDNLAYEAVTRLPALLRTRTVELLLHDSADPPGHYRVVTRDTPPSTAHHRIAAQLDDTVAMALGQTTRPIVRRGAPLALPSRGAPGSPTTALWAPLRWNETLRGVLVVGPHLSGDLFDEHDVDGVANAAGILTLAFQALDLVGSLRERTDTLVSLTHRLSHAHEQERAHLSRELHDVVAQELIALTRQLRRYGDGTTPPPAIWADMLAAAQDALTATRRICNGLRPAILDLGLVPALRDLVSDATERSDATEVSLSVAGAEQRLPGEREFALFRVAQEGLSNALEHAKARQIRVEVVFDGAVVLRVRDDGRGFVVPARFEDFPGDHLGLIGMRERLAELGGTLAVTSMPGRGTVMEACMPL